MHLELDLSQTRLREHRNLTLTLPDPHEVTCYRFKRSSFVKREQSLTLIDGAPQETTLIKPSGAKALTGAVSAITGTLKDAVPNLINVRVEAKNKELSQRERALELREAALQQPRTRDNGAGHHSVGPPGR